MIMLSTMDIVSTMFSLSCLDKPFHFYIEPEIIDITGHLMDIPVELVKEHNDDWVLYVFKTTIDALTHNEVMTYYEIGADIDEIFIDDNFVAHFISGDNEVTIKCLED